MARNNRTQEGIDGIPVNRSEFGSFRWLYERDLREGPPSADERGGQEISVFYRGFPRRLARIRT
jgi:hypothetical protein